MRLLLILKVSATALLAAGAGGCDKPGAGQSTPGADGAPDEQALQKIRYMSTTEPTGGGHKLYAHLEEARSCGDFELAMRWNRPPKVAGGAFHQKMTYLQGGIPADLPKNTEVFFKAQIERGETLPSGSARWYLRMQDGTLVQAIETASYWEKQEQDSQEGKWVALVEPTRPHRTFCGQGVYQGRIGKSPDQDESIPLISVLFAMDRRK